MIEGPLKADGRLAAKNATKIRAALTQVTNFKSVFNRYQETQPQPTDDKTKDRARARAWLMLNVGFNNEALHNAIMHCWAEAYVLGQDAAGEWIRKAEKAQKALQDEMINWDTWKPGDRATALLIKPIGGFQRYLEQSGGASYFKKFDKETVEMLGTSLADAIEAGLDSESAALLMKNHVGSAGRALTIAITEQNRAMSFSTIQRYKEAELQKMEWHVSDPCDKCAQNSGQVVEIGQPFKSGNNQPPAHPHCRCVLLPVIPGMEEESTMADGTPMPSTAGGVTMPVDYSRYARLKPVIGSQGIRGEIDTKPVAKMMNEHTDFVPTSEELQAISDYTSGKGYYGIVNSYLRDPNDFETWAYPQDKDKANEIIKGLDSVISKTKGLEQDTLTFRGIWGREITESFLSLKPGDTISDAGYVSTSLSVKTAEIFARSDQANAGVILEIINPKGSKGTFPQAIGRKVTSEELAKATESEWILPKGTQLEVLEVDAKNKKVRVVVK